MPSLAVFGRALLLEGRYGIRSLVLLSSGGIGLLDLIKGHCAGAHLLLHTMDALGLFSEALRWVTHWYWRSLGLEWRNGME